jgi:PAS domain S-box-containing protein
LQNVIKLRQRSELEGVYCDSKGNEVCLHHVIVPVFSNEGTLTSLAVVTSDVTVHKRAVEGLKQSLERLNQAQRLGGIADWEYDVINKKVTWSENLFRIFELDPRQQPPEYPGQLELYHPESAKLLRAAVDRAINDGEPYELELKRIQADGTEIQFQVLGVPDTDRDGNVIRLYGTVLDITKRKEYEKELLRNEARLESLINILQHPFSSVQDFLDYALHEGIRLTDSEIGYIYHYDDESERFILNTWSKDVMHECSIVKPQTCYELRNTGLWGEAVRQGKHIIVNDYQADNPLKKGTPKGHVTLRKYMTIPVFRDGRIISVVGMANKEKDYTSSDVNHLRLLMDAVWKVLDRNEAEQSLRKSEERFRLSMDATMDGLWDWDIRSGDVYFSPWYRKMLGYTEAEFPSHVDSWKRIIHPDDKEFVLKINDDCIQGRLQDFEIEYRLVANNGEWKWLLGRGKAVKRDGQGKALRMLGTHTDITARKIVEQALKESEEHYRILFESTQSPILLYDPEDDCFVNANPAATAMYGYSQEEFKKIGKADISVELGQTEDALKRLLRSNEKTHIVRQKHKRKSGEIFIVNMTSNPVHLKGKLYYSTIIQDVSAQVERERNLLEAKEAAEEASKIKSEFLANMSHEIRTPMNGVLGMLQLLQTTNIDKEQREYILTAIQSSKRLTRLLSDILDLSKVEANRLTIQSAPLDLAEVIEQTCELFKPTAQQTQIEFRCKIDPKIPSRLHGDAARLQQVLTNIIGNAFKFTKQGRISVEVDRLDTSDQSQARVLFSVTDTGIGISDDKAAQLFQPFSQLNTGYRRDYQGAGLGLSICKRLVELMGGSISMEGKPGQGTTVHFSVTFSMDEPLPAPENTIQAPSERKTLRILLAEDDFVNRLCTTKLLEKHGHAVIAVEDGQEALSQLKDGDFDVVLMDIQMPIMDGMEATTAIRNGFAGKSNDNIPIIAMTAYAMAGEKEKFLAAGMSGYVAKPVDVRRILQVVAETLA